MISATAAAGRAETGLAMETIEGDGAVYNLRSRGFSMPRVRVSLAGGRVVPGAFVTFRLPDAGPGAIFAEGRIVTVSTDVLGEAAVPPMRMNSQLGPWEIRISATHQGLVARSSIQQINAAPVDAMTAGGAKRSRGLYWLAIAAASAATLATVGVVAGGSSARSGGVSAPGAAAAQPLTISVGTGSAGAP